MKALCNNICSICADHMDNPICSYSHFLVCCDKNSKKNRKEGKYEGDGNCRGYLDASACEVYHF